jgi:hypothetical protein
MMITHSRRRDLTIISVAVIAVTICFSLIAGLVGNLQVSFAQEEAAEPSATQALLGEVNSTIIAISGLMATAISIVTGIVAWLRARFGDRVISNDTNSWLQSIFEQVRQKDNDLRDVFRQVLEKHAEIDTVLTVVKGSNPELATKIDEAMPQVQKKLQEIQTKVAKWQADADKIYSVTPTSDPVGK